MVEGTKEAPKAFVIGDVRFDAIRARVEIEFVRGESAERGAEIRTRRAVREFILEGRDAKGRRVSLEVLPYAINWKDYEYGGRKFATNAEERPAKVTIRDGGREAVLYYSLKSGTHPAYDEDGWPWGPGPDYEYMSLDDCGGKPQKYIKDLLPDFGKDSGFCKQLAAFLKSGLADTARSRPDEDFAENVEYKAGKLGIRTLVIKEMPAPAK